MSVLISMLSLQAGEPSDKTAQSILTDAAGRVRSMMLLYDKLYLSRNFSDLDINEFLPQLVEKVLEIFPGGSMVKTELELDRFVLKAKTLSALGIIVNEMISNSMKYAFRDSVGGTISLQAKKTGDTVEISYSDNGIGLPESVNFESSNGFGMQLISLLVSQINGTIQIERSAGLTYIMQFKVPDASE